MDPQRWVDEMEPRWREVWERLDIAYDDYIRTTEPRHTAVVVKLLDEVYRNGRDDIYLDTYEGLYCVSCELYYAEGDLLEGGLCPIHERPVELVKEQNYFFRLSAYRDRLLEHYEQRPSAVEPEVRRNEVLSLIRGGLQDFSISRTNFDWGIPLPWDPDHVMLRLVRRPDQLHHGGRLRVRRGAVPQDLAREHPHDRQGHPAPARDLLAGDADGSGHRATGTGLGPWVPHRGREEDVEDESHRDPPVRAHRPVRRRLLPLVLPSRGPVRPRRVVLTRVDGGPPQRRARERDRQPRLSGARDAPLLLRRGRSGGRTSRAPSPTCPRSSPRRSADTTRRCSPSDRPPRSPPSTTWSCGPTGTWSSAPPGPWRRTRRGGTSSARSSTPRRKPFARWRSCSPA